MPSERLPNSSVLLSTSSRVPGVSKSGFPVQPRSRELFHDEAAAGVAGSAATRRATAGPFGHEVFGRAEEVDAVALALVVVEHAVDRVEGDHLDRLRDGTIGARDAERGEPDPRLLAVDVALERGHRAVRSLLLEDLRRLGDEHRLVTRAALVFELVDRVAEGGRAAVAFAEREASQRVVDSAGDLSGAEPTTGLIDHHAVARCLANVLFVLVEAVALAPVAALLILGGVALHRAGAEGECAKRDTAG